ncbi:hypothetical protein NESM_000147400 [Novymonas esmeraldas]|uniref:FPL domain-containing protein n=1 Tax=Novymonas esmeraldas TaxID=1808958 RepID=A0AAW0F5E3_9TRYP
MDKIKEVFGRPDKFSLENAHRLCGEVERVEEALLDDAGAAERRSGRIDAALQRLRELTEVLVWMDRHREESFEQVMERDVMNTLERLVTNGLMPSAVKLQSLQSVTVLLQNLSRAPSLYYVCSNNHINRMVAVEFDMHDDEFVSLYVSFLKSLALRCTPDTVQFFFDVQDGAFPLWDRAVRLLGSEDAMVRTAAKQIIVTVAQLQDSAVSAFVAASIADVLRSVMRFVDTRLAFVAATVPSWGALNAPQRGTASGGEGSAGSAGAASSPAEATSPPLKAVAPRTPLVVNTRDLRLQLEEVEDELLYMNDLCRTPVANAGAEAAAALQRLLLPRFRSTVEAEVLVAGSASATVAVNAAYAKYVTPSPRLGSADVPANVALAFLFYWTQVNTDAQIAAALVRFFLEPPEQSPTSSRHTVAAMVLESTRVDLHETVVAVCYHALSRTAATAAPSIRMRLSASLGQFFFADTPYQQTGRVLAGGPGSTAPPEKEKFMQKAWPATPAGSSGALAPLIPHLIAALYAQLKYFHVTRPSCIDASVSLLLQLLSDTAADRSVCTGVYVQLMKLVQRSLLDCVKQYASVIQAAVEAQKAAAGTVPISCISFSDLLDAADEEAPLLIRDPYTPMFLKLKEAAAALPVCGAPWLPDASGMPPRRHRKSDLFLFYPAYPPLLSERGGLVLHAWPPLLPVSLQPPRGATQWAAAYHAVQESAAQAFDYATRSPVADAECELNVYLMFLLVRRAFASCAGGGRGDLLHTTLRRLAPQYGPSTYYTISDATTALSVRCEITSEWHADSLALPIAPLGTPVCLVLPHAVAGQEGRELLLLDVPLRVPEQVRSQELLTGEYKRRVLGCFDLAFVGVAVHPRYPFKVVVSYQLPSSTAWLHLVTSSAATARTTVSDIEVAANECRQRGASFCFGLMNYKAALVEDGDA